MKTAPMKHQARCLDQMISSTNKNWFAAWPVGFGKTWLAIAYAEHLYNKGDIDAVIVIAAPNPLHNIWVPEFEKHGSLDIASSDWPLKTMRDRAGHNDAIKFKGLSVFTYNVEAFVSSKAQVSCRNVLESRRCLMIIDQSASIKSHKKKTSSGKLSRAEAIRLLGTLAGYRMCLDGNYCAEGAWELYGQFGFLNKDIIGERNWSSFCNRYCVLNKFYAVDRCVNTDQLMQKIQPYTLGILPGEEMNLPGRTIMQFPFELGKEEKEAYKMLAKTGMYDGTPCGSPLDVAIRLGQVGSGYLNMLVKDDQGRTVNILPYTFERTRLRALSALLEQIGKAEQVVIMTSQVREVEDIKEMLGEACCTFYGEDNDDERAYNKEKFISGQYKYIVGTEQVLGIGHTLVNARYQVFYSNSLKLRLRLESLGRLYRKGQERGVIVYDLVAVGSLDKKILRVLESKTDVADMVASMGGEFFTGLKL